MARKYYVFVCGAIVFESTSELVAYEYARLCKVSPDDRQVYVSTRKRARP